LAHRDIFLRCKIQSLSGHGGDRPSRTNPASHNANQSTQSAFSGVVRSAGFENAGRLGALAAAEVIQHIGARPQVLTELAKQAGLPV
jgi:hypothetical protein